MYFERKEITLKDGRKAILRNPEVSDAAQLLEYLKITAEETHFLLRCPEECTMTLEQEEEYLRFRQTLPGETMILCEVDGEIAGNCQMSRKNKIKNRHRAMIGIALKKKYWDLGIGTAMFRELLKIAQEDGIEQVELEVIEGNERAIALYTKMDFCIVGIKPKAIKLPDGTYLSEYYMVREL